MLVLTRHTSESILIGEDIKITVVKVTGRDTVRIGIEAPQGLNIVRTELTISCQQGETHEDHDT
ncbi:MAG: carbon storage regulator [Thermoguttaceae bacterium]|nr:carbon storage regulator [Thermoguttaceae bacterium]